MCKLYAWQPVGHGELSFFVVADSQEEAEGIVNAEMKRRMSLEWFDDDYLSEYEITGWGTNYYTLTVAEKGTVITNSND